MLIFAQKSIQSCIPPLETWQEYFHNIHSPTIYKSMFDKAQEMYEVPF